MSDNDIDDDDYEFDDKLGTKGVNLLASGYIKDTKVILTTGQWQDLYDNNFFGLPENSTLVLDPEEAVLLAERGRIKIFKTKDLVEEISLDQFVNIVSAIQENFWRKYIVYKDLRGRGYVVRAGYGELAPYRRYPRGARPNKAQSDTFIFPFAEGSFISLSELDSIVKQAQANRKVLLLGMVDRSGDVTYYKAAEFTIPVNTEKFEFLEDLVDKKASEKNKRVDFNKE